MKKEWVKPCHLPPIKMVGGLVAIFYFPIYWECHHPNWRNPSFFRGVFSQPPTSCHLPPIKMVTGGWCRWHSLPGGRILGGLTEDYEPVAGLLLHHLVSNMRTEIYVPLVRWCSDWNAHFLCPFLQIHRQMLVCLRKIGTWPAAKSIDHRGFQLVMGVPP